MRENYPLRFSAVANPNAKSSVFGFFSVGMRYATKYCNPVGSGLWSRGVHIRFFHAFPEPLLASMDLIHENTTPEGMRPSFIGFGLDRIGMVRSIPVDIAARRGTARRWFRRFVGGDN